MSEDQTGVNLSYLSLNEELVRFFAGPVTKEQVVEDLAGRLFNGGFVRESFASAVLDREQVFPTGLPTVPFGIAIPHTDTEHVLRGAIAVGILDHPVDFQEMGGEEGDMVSAHIVMMLAIDQPEAVAAVLRQLALTFQNQDFLLSLKQSSDPETVVEIITARLPDVIHA